MPRTNTSPKNDNPDSAVRAAANKRRLVAPLFAGTEEGENDPIYADEIGHVSLYRVVMEKGKKRRLLISDDQKRIEIEPATTTKEMILAAYPKWDEFYIEATNVDTGHFIKGSGHPFYANLDDPEDDPDDKGDDQGVDPNAETREEMMMRLRVERDDRDDRNGGGRRRGNGDPDPMIMMMQEQAKLNASLMEKQLVQAQNAPNDALDMATKLIGAVAPARGEASAEDLSRLRRECDDLRTENRRLMVAKDSEVAEIREDYRGRARVLEKSNDADRQRFDEELRRMRNESDEARRRSLNEVDELRKKMSNEYDDLKKTARAEYESLKNKADNEIERLKNEMHKLRGELAQTIEVPEPKALKSGNENNKPWWVDDVVGPGLMSLGEFFKNPPEDVIKRATDGLEQRLRAEYQQKFAEEAARMRDAIANGAPPPERFSSPPDAGGWDARTSTPSPAPVPAPEPPAAMAYGNVWKPTAPAAPNGAAPHALEAPADKDVAAG